jgi:hypothetical protein
MLSSTLLALDLLQLSFLILDHPEMALSPKGFLLQTTVRLVSTAKGCQTLIVGWAD